MSLVQIRAAAFPNVFLRLDGRGVDHPVDPGAGVVNLQYGAGPWETFERVFNADATVSFRSNAFPNVFLRLDGRGVDHPVDHGAGVVNAQYTAGPWEKFKVVSKPDQTLSLEAASFPNVFLRLDGRGVDHPVDHGAGVVNAQYTAGPWESLVVCDCVTPAQVNGAMDQFIQWFPAEAGNINGHRAQIMRACCPPFAASAQDLATLAAVQHAAPANLVRALDGSDPSPCDRAVGDVVVDGIFLIGSLVGLQGLIQDRLRAAEYALLGPYRNNLMQSIRNFKVAWDSKNYLEAARSIRTLFSGIWTVVLKPVYQMMKDTMSWWDWIRTGISAVAQLIAWFGSSGVALVAQLVLVVMSATQLALDVNTAVQTCG